MVLVIFATNIKPGELVDEAFLRRIHYKIFVPSPTKDDFAKIFRAHQVEDYIAQSAAFENQVVSFVRTNNSWVWDGIDTPTVSRVTFTAGTEPTCNSANRGALVLAKAPLGPARHRGF